jgi:hypothetical protein
MDESLHDLLGTNQRRKKTSQNEKRTRREIEKKVRLPERNVKNLLRSHRSRPLDATYQG